MRRWNGWGDEAVEHVLHEGALAFLAGRLGAGTPFPDATFEAVCAEVPASRLPPHRLVVTDAATRVRHAHGQSLPDWLRLRYGRVGPVPDGVAYPEGTGDVRELLDYARAYGIALIIHGGGTSVAGHLSVPDGRAVLAVNMTRMRRLLALDSTAQLATFGAGVLGPDLEAQLRTHGYVLGHYPQSFEYSTLGGWIATRSSGQQSLRYGRIEQLFAGGTVETFGGTLRIPAFPASAAGPDLRELVLGSEGRIGVITEATVRVSPLPEREAFHAVFFADWEAAIGAARTLAQAQRTTGLSLLRLSNAVETETMLALAGHARAVGLLQAWLRLRGCGTGKCMLLVGASGSRAQVRHALRQALAACRAHGGVHVGSRLGDKWRQGRFRNVYLRNTAWRHGYAIDTVETAVGWGGVTDMMTAIEAAARQALGAAGEPLHAYTHLSHVYPQGASVYTTFVWRLAGDFDADMARWRAVKDAASGAIVDGGGTISHQHGVGTDHAPWLAAEKGAAGIAALRAVLTHFDPQGLCNPGKLLMEEGMNGAHWSPGPRDLDRVLAQQWDLLVVGGGITGAGVLLEAARRGLKALLVERRDFAWGTSSRSSKLVHGGLRYLKEGRFALTREAVREREALLAGAPGLVEPLGFALGAYAGRKPGRHALLLGLALYDRMAGQRARHWHGRDEFLTLAPGIATAGLRGGICYRDARTDDARLVLRVLQEAQRLGGTALNYVAVTQADGGRALLSDQAGGGSATVRARLIVNATGAAADALRPGPRRIRPLRGSHLVLPAWRLPLAQAVSLMHPADGRPVFAFPWEGATLVGTTDLDHAGDLAREPSITQAEADYLLAALRWQFPTLGLGEDDVIATFAGVRPIAGTGVGTGAADPSKEAREHALWRDDGMLTVTGGKLTTFRAMALDVLRAARPALPGWHADLAPGPVFAPVAPPGDRRLPPGQARRLAGRYGAHAAALVGAAADDELETIAGTDTLWAELRWAARHEAVRHLDDLLLRRTRLGILLRDGGGAHVLARVRAICKPELGWSDARWASEHAAYLALCASHHSLPARRRTP